MALEWKDLQNIFREQEEEQTNSPPKLTPAEQLKKDRLELEREKLNLAQRQQRERERRAALIERERTHTPHQNAPPPEKRPSEAAFYIWSAFAILTTFVEFIIFLIFLK